MRAADLMSGKGDLINVANISFRMRNESTGGSSFVFGSPVSALDIFYTLSVVSLIGLDHSLVCLFAAAAASALVVAFHILVHEFPRDANPTNSDVLLTLPYGHVNEKYTFFLLDSPRGG